MSELISEKTIEKATGTPWPVWFERLEAMGARELAHKDIAAALVAEFQVGGWWAQSLTVRYERVIGRRQIGQNNKGEFSISLTKTIPVSMDEAFYWWLKLAEARSEFNGVAIVSSSTTKTEKWRYYRAALVDGSRVIVGIYAKNPTKAGLGLQHEKLLSPDVTDAWRHFWKSLLAND